jgi:hypothetical protein
MKSEDEVSMIEIFAGTPWQAGMVKNLLENEGIQAFIADEIIGTLNPWWTAPGGAGAIKVRISSADYEQAKLIVEEYERNLEP